MILIVVWFVVWMFFVWCGGLCFEYFCFVSSKTNRFILLANLFKSMLDKKQKRPVPAIHPETGMIKDYMNELVPLLVGYSTDGIDSVKKQIKETPVHKYMKRYPAHEYNHPELTPSVKQRILDLDRLIDNLNLNASKSDFTYDHLEETRKKVYEIIYDENYSPSSN